MTHTLAPPLRSVSLFSTQSAYCAVHHLSTFDTDPLPELGLGFGRALSGPRRSPKIVSFTLLPDLGVGFTTNFGARSSPQNAKKPTIWRFVTFSRRPSFSFSTEGPLRSGPTAGSVSTPPKHALFLKK